MSASDRAQLIREFRSKRTPKERSTLNRFGGETLTQKQNDWLNLTKESGDPVGSALEVYDTESRDTAAQLVKHNMSRASIRDEVEGCMEGAGLSTINVMTELGECLKAQKDGYTTKEGEFIEGGPDRRIRLDAVKEALKLKDAYPQKEEAPHLHLHAHMVEQLSQLSFSEITSMMKAEVMTERLKAERATSVDSLPVNTE